jgi:hypothetical protein
VVFGRRHRRALAGWLILALLFMQFAVAAHACPRAAADPSAVAALAAMAEMPGCDGAMATTVDLEQPQLCKAHCERDAQTVSPISAIDLPAATSMPAVLDGSPRSRLAAAGTAPHGPQPSGIPPPGSPPLYLALLVLRR